MRFRISTPPAVAFLCFAALAAPRCAEAAAASADVNGDGIVNALDLLLIQNQWMQTPPPPEGEPVTAEGFVTAGSGGEPVPSGTVTLRRYGTDIAQTEVSAGAFRFEGIPAGEYVIVFDHPRYRYVDAVVIGDEVTRLTLAASPADPMALAIASISNGDFGAGAGYLDRVLLGDPTDPVALAYACAARFLDLFEHPPAGLADVMSALRIKIGWFGDPALEIPEMFPPDSPALGAAAAGLAAAVPVIDRCLGDIQTIKTHPEFSFHPLGFERWAAPDLEIDLSDALIAEAALLFIKQEILMAQYYQYGVQFNVLDEPGFDPISLFDEFPVFLAPNPAKAALPAQAKAALRQGLDALEAAADSIRKETDAQANDFAVLSASDALDLAEGVQKVRSGLDAPQTFAVGDSDRGIDHEVPVHFGAYYARPPTRALMPAFRSDMPLLSSYPDPTFNGLFPGMTRDRLGFFLPSTYGVTAQTRFPESAAIPHAWSYSIAHAGGTLYALNERSNTLVAYNGILETAQTLPLDFPAGEASAYAMAADGARLAVWGREGGSDALWRFHPGDPQAVDRLELPDYAGEAGMPGMEPIGLRVAGDALEFLYAQFDYSNFDFLTNLIRISAAASRPGAFSAATMPVGDEYIQFAFVHGGLVWAGGYGDTLVIDPGTSAIKRIYGSPDSTIHGFPHPSGPAFVTERFEETPDFFGLVYELVIAAPGS